MAEFICDFEGFKSTPYKDLSKGGLVIGCGMRAGNRKSITKEESYGAMYYAVNNLRKEAQAVYPNLNSEQIAGVVSIRWNTPLKRDITENEKIIRAIKTEDRRTVETFYRNQIVSLERFLNVSLGGLHKRRSKELDLIFKTL